jgi:hypothetical protein
MESPGRLDAEAVGAFVPEVLVFSEPEILFLLALAGLVQLLRPYLVLLLSHSNSALGLTRREIEVLAWVAGGQDECRDCRAPLDRAWNREEAP